LRWLDHGLSFKVFAKEDFEQKVLPTYFQKQSKYWSFTRKLGRWGFVRITSGSESGSYQHPLFRRDEPELLSRMTCQSSNTAVATAATVCRGPPNRSTVAEMMLASQDNNRKLHTMRGLSSLGGSHHFGQSLPSDLDDASKRMILAGRSRQLDPLLASNQFYPSLHPSHSSLEILSEQQRQQRQLLHLASRTSTASAVGSPMPSLYESGLGPSGNTSCNSMRGIDVLQERERLLAQEILRQQMQQEEEKLLFQLMVENRRNQIAGTHHTDLLNQYRQNLTFASSGNSLNYLQTQASRTGIPMQNSTVEALDAATIDQHNGGKSNKTKLSSPEGRGQNNLKQQTEKEKQDHDEKLTMQVLQLHQEQRHQQQKSQDKQFSDSRKPQN
jgi:HSF-type DNA-binding